MGRDVVKAIRVAGEHHLKTMIIVKNAAGLIPDEIRKYDNSLKIDQSFFPFLSGALTQRARVVGKRGRLFPFDLVAAIVKLKKAIRYCEMAKRALTKVIEGQQVAKPPPHGRG